MRVLLGLVLALATACWSTPAPDPVPREVTGAITQIERADDGGIVAFSVEDREAYRIRIDPTRDYGFDLEHLVEHQTTGDPVRVTTEQRDGEAYALEIVDA